MSSHLTLCIMLVATVIFMPLIFSISPGPIGSWRGK